MPQFSSSVVRPKRRWLIPVAAGFAAATTSASPASAAVGWAPALSPISEAAPGEDAPVGLRISSATAVDHDGTTWAAWLGSDNQKFGEPEDATWSVQVASKPAGGTWTRPQAVGTLDHAATAQFDSISSVAIVVDDAGRPTVAWTATRWTGAFGDVDEETGEVIDHVKLEVSSATRSAAGAWGAPTVLTSAAFDGTVTPHRGIALDVAHDGSVVAAWQTADGVYLSSRSAAGSWQPTPTVIADVPVSSPDLVGLGRDADGWVTIVYAIGGDPAADDVDPDVRTVEARTISPSGNVSDPVALSADATNVDQPRLIVDETGAAVATWGSGAGARAAVRAARAAGDAWSAPVALSTGSANGAPAPSNRLDSALAPGRGVPTARFDAHGAATVVWPERDPSPVVKVRRVTQEGTWGPASVVATGSADTPPAAPTVALGLDGEAAVAWVTEIKQTFTPGVGVSQTGGDVQVAGRASASASWSAPVQYRVAGYGDSGRVTGSGNPTRGNVPLAGNGLGDATLVLTGTALVPNSRAVESTTYAGANAKPALDWTSRGITGSSNLATWESYLFTNWPGPGPTASRGVELSNGASRPEPTDRSSWRFTESDAWVDPDTGKTVVQYKGTLRWVNTAHYIDSVVTDPRLEIAADGASARIYSDGQASGSMADAIAGNPTKTLVKNGRLLDLDLSGRAPQLSGDGSTKTWAAVPAKLANDAGNTYGMGMYIGRPFGTLRVSIPAHVQVRTTPTPMPDPEKTATPAPTTAPALAPAPTPVPGGRALQAELGIGGTLKGSKRAKSSVKITLGRALGTSSTKTYRVKVYAKGQLVATGTVKGKSLALRSVNLAKKGKQTQFAKLTGVLVVKPATSFAGKKIPATQRIKPATIEVK